MSKEKYMHFHIHVLVQHSLKATYDKIAQIMLKEITGSETWEETMQLMWLNEWRDHVLCLLLHCEHLLFLMLVVIHLSTVSQGVILSLKQKEMVAKHITRSVKVFTVFFTMYEQALMRMLLLKDDCDWSPQHETQGNQLSEPDEFLSVTCKRQKKKHYN